MDQDGWKPADHRRERVATAGALVAAGAICAAFVLRVYVHGGNGGARDSGFRSR